MKIITISRQFGSGGRELGKRLSDLLAWDYYDREIIDMLARKQGTDPEYVHRMLNGHELHHFQPSFRHSFQQHTGVHSIEKPACVFSGSQAGFFICQCLMYR